MLELKEVCAYKNNSASEQIFGPVNLQVANGEICTIIGPSGCGTTSLLKTIAGINSRFEGEISFDTCPLSPRKSKISYIPHNYGILSHLTLKDNILLPLSIKKIAIDKEVIFRLHYLADLLSIESALDKYPLCASNWELGSSAIARSLLPEPDVLLLDDPFSNLDLYERECAQKKLKKLLREHTTITLVATHSIEESIYLGNRVIVFSSGAGKIIADITALQTCDEDRTSGRFAKLTSIIRQLIKKDWRENQYEKVQNIS